MKEENNTEKKEFPKDIDYVNPYVGLDKIYEKRSLQKSGGRF